MSWAWGGGWRNLGVASRFVRRSWEPRGILCVKMRFFARFLNFQPVMKAKLPALGYYRNREIPTH